MTAIVDPSVGTGRPPPQKVLEPAKAGVLRVRIYREPFCPVFELSLDNGHTEELEPEETRDWFKLRGANMDVVEKALDSAWAFPHKDIYLEIEKPRTPPNMDPRVAPNV